jgi:hypothetical protein
MMFKSMCRGASRLRRLSPDGQPELSADGHHVALLIPAMICRFYQGWFQMLLIDVPLFTASSFSIAVFYLMSERELFPKTW